MKRVLVTGAAGFLGSHLMLRHLVMGDEVLGIDNYSSSCAGSTHVKTMRRYDKALLATGDITDASFDKAITAFYHASESYKSFDIIYNFACPASPPIYQSMPIETMMTCVAGTRRVLELARAHKSVFVQASTSEIYGDPSVWPQHESYLGNVNSYGPRSCYDEGKRAAEALCFDYMNTYGVDARLVRIFNTYGPHMDPDDGRVVTNFIKQALLGQKLTIYGEGKQTRSFCYVDDLISGIIRLAELTKNPLTPINLGNPVEFTMIQLASLVLGRASGLKGGGAVGFNNLDFKPIPKDDPRTRCPDITNAKTFLNWEPKVSLEEGLGYMFAYMKSVVNVDERRA